MWMRELKLKPFFGFTGAGGGAHGGGRGMNLHGGVKKIA